MIQLYSLCGFLGIPSDWNFLSSRLYRKEINTIPIAPQLSNSPTRSNAFTIWASDFNKVLENQQEARVLLGYSLGGRLAMHALLDSPHLWKGAILVSCHPGLQSNEQRLARLASDSLWAERFSTLFWEELMQSWNSQGVLTSSYSLKRIESNYSRSELSRQLIDWSLGKQEDLNQKIEDLNLPILWIAGKKDQAYSGIVSQMQFSHPQSSIWIAKNSGHRVPWDAPMPFTKHVAQFIQQITKTKIQ